MLFKSKTLQRAGAAPKSGADFWLGAGLGVLFFLLVYGPSTLDVTYDSWIYAGYIEWDIVQRYAGWMFYRSADWAWPLTVANNLAAPLGVSIAYTDSIPLLGLALKLFSPLLPATFQYSGWYNLFNCALQGGFSMLLLRHFSLERWYCLAAAALFVSFPVCVERLFRHDGLASQWILLAALLFYFRARRGNALPSPGMLALCVIAPGVSTYFLPMVYAVLLAALLEYALRQRRVRQPLLYMGVCLFCSLATMYLLGLLTRGGGEAPAGFGEFSMNLNGPFNPSSLDDYAPDKRLAWSRVLPVLPQRHRQYDGFSYLGLGVLAAAAGLLAWGLAKLVRGCVRREHGFARGLWAFAKSHGFLLAFVAFMALFSLSHVVTLNDRVLFTLPLPGPLLRLCSIFRSSGRFFWPLAYLLLLGIAVVLGRAFRGRGGLLAIALVVAVQLFDLSGVLAQKHDYFYGGPIVADNEFETEQWIYFAQNNDNVYCLGPIFDYDMAAGIIRYNPDVTSNILLANRGNFAEIHASYEPMMDFLRSGAPLPENTLYLCTDDDTLRYVMEGIHPDARAYRTGRYRIVTNDSPDCPFAAYTPPE